MVLCYVRLCYTEIKRVALCVQIGATTEPPPRSHNLWSTSPWYASEINTHTPTYLLTYCYCTDLAEMLLLFQQSSHYLLYDADLPFGMTPSRWGNFKHPSARQSPYVQSVKRSDLGLMFTQSVASSTKIIVLAEKLKLQQRFTYTSWFWQSEIPTIIHGCSCLQFQPFKIFWLSLPFGFVPSRDIIYFYEIPLCPE